MKTPGADLADILASDTPDLWKNNPPAKTGDTGALFQRIIATALELRERQHADAPTRLMSSARAKQKLQALDTPTAPRAAATKTSRPATAKTTAAKAATAKKAPATRGAAKKTTAKPAAARRRATARGR
ncbi:MAG: hypothetical protein U0P30_06315 [Vicinamibacterales bacterium]